jgi:hypothetical protein
LPPLCPMGLVNVFSICCWKSVDSIVLVIFKFQTLK